MGFFGQRGNVMRVAFEKGRLQFTWEADVGFMPKFPQKEGGGGVGGGSECALFQERAIGFARRIGWVPR